ncbi:hypothetical protein [Prolixibacter denitrificans]|nr:hypothetical protein [Prolixibacter denitrificans]
MSTYAIKGAFPYPKWILYTLILLSFLSFSRKEFALTIVYLLSIYISTRNKTHRLKYYIFASFAGLFIISLYLILFFRKANEVALSDNYVRFQLIEYSIQIIKDYFPFGTGPGTFGSQLSLQYPIIYEKYGVGPNILGYNGHRGPIYDAFLFTFTAEMGIGIILYLILLVSIWRKKPLINNHVLKTTKRFIIIAIFIIGLFAPVIMNPFGLISFSILGLISKNGN